MLGGGIRRRYMAQQKNISVYRDIFKRAFQMIRHNKLLWAFGFFAAFLGAGGELEHRFPDRHV
jgi:hypothetical protein